MRSQYVNSYKLQSVHVKLLAYADYVANFCKDMESTSATVSLTTHFYKVIGAAVNWEKNQNFFTVDGDKAPADFEARNSVNIDAFPSNTMRTATLIGLVWPHI